MKTHWWFTRIHALVSFNFPTRKPQNCAIAKVNRKTLYGMVQKLCMLVDHMGVSRDVVILWPITNIFPKQTNIPTARFQYYLHLYHTFVGWFIRYEDAVAANPSDIQCIAAYRFLPPKIFGIKKDGIIPVTYNHQAVLNIYEKMITFHKLCINKVITKKRPTYNSMR
ncbi:hypothetical protein VP01_1609g2 [Puccinia sorghi]|uniref:Uncharacterized protein n=1 Tax=Puccinia sorghi TaxID=27349 RepID=A0A0L6VH74_9BASI|nr:hypothetical protein VP01_1609g2 [Puccinia sorghi]